MHRGGDPLDAPLVLAPGAVVLRGIHDCLSLHARIAADGGREPFDEASTGPLGDLLLVHQPAESASRPRSIFAYRIDAETAALLERFRRPKSYWTCCLEISAEADARFPDWSDLERLRELGALAAAAPPQPVALGAR